MKEKLNGFLCKALGHEWDYGPENSDIRTCPRCGKKERGTVVSRDGSTNVKWEII